MIILRTILLMLVFIGPAHSLEWDWYGDETKILLHGDINEGDGQAFQNLLEDPAFDRVTAVVMGESHGGNAEAAINIGATIAVRGMDTYTTADCYSACVLVASGGIKKYVLSSAKLGVHWIALAEGQQISADMAAASTQLLYSRMWGYYEAVGVKADAMIFLQLQAGPDIKVLSKSELKNLGFIVEK